MYPASSLARHTARKATSSDTLQGQPEPDRPKVGEVIGCEHLALNDREIYLYLIELTFIK